MARPINSYEVVLEQSGYVAWFGAMSYKDVFSVLDDFNDETAQMESLYDLIYSSLYRTNIVLEGSGVYGVPDFMTWLNTTAYLDVETMLFGIYCATYPEKSKISVTCAKCKDSQEYEIFNKQLRQPPKDVSRMNLYLERCHKAKCFVRNVEQRDSLSVLGKDTKDVYTTSSGNILIHLKHPTLFETLTYYRETSPETREHYRPEFDVSMFVDSVYVKANQAPEEPLKYHTVTDRSAIVITLANLDLDDHKTIARAVNETYMQSTVRYEIAGAVCRRETCHVPLGRVPMDIAETLFYTKSRKLPISFMTDSDSVRKEKMAEYTENRAKVVSIKNDMYRCMLENLESFKGALSFNDVLTSEIPTIHSLVIAQASKLKKDAQIREDADRAMRDKQMKQAAITQARRK